MFITHLRGVGTTANIAGHIRTCAASGLILQVADGNCVSNPVAGLKQIRVFCVRVEAKREVMQNYAPYGAYSRCNAGNHRVPLESRTCSTLDSTPSFDGLPTPAHLSGFHAYPSIALLLPCGVPCVLLGTQTLVERHERSKHRIVRLESFVQRGERYRGARRPDVREEIKYPSLSYKGCWKRLGVHFEKIVP